MSLHSDTRKFFQIHCEEILEMVENIKQECGKISFNLDTNTLAWVGYEEIIRKISYEFGY